MKFKFWLWAVGIALLVLALLGYLIYNVRTIPTFEFNDPNIIVISQGTEGTMDGLDIGVTFVGGGSAGVSLHVKESGKVEQFDLAEDEAITYEGYKILLVESLMGNNSAVFRVTKAE